MKDGRHDIEDQPRAGRPSSSSTPEMIAQVRELVDIDPHLTIEEIALILDISTGSVHAILHDSLEFNKISARWIPKLLSKEQKMKRVSCSKKLLAEYEHCDPRRLYEIVTGDETWIKFTETTRKQQSKYWLPKNSYTLKRPVRTLESPRFCIAYFSMRMVL